MTTMLIMETVESVSLKPRKPLSLSTEYLEYFGEYAVIFGMGAFFRGGGVVLKNKGLNSRDTVPLKIWSNSQF
jgi:hypothetical protein